MARFGLYPSRETLAPQRVTAAMVLALDTPLDVAGVVHFGRSFWLPVPPGLAAVAALRLVDSSLQLRFDADRFAVSTGRRDWFPEVKRLDAERLQIGFAWPAEVVQLAPARFDRQNHVELFRADGDAVADDAAASGVTGRDLAQPWVGSPLVVKIGPRASLLGAGSERLFAGSDKGPSFGANAPTRAIAAAGVAAPARSARPAPAAALPGLAGAEGAGAASAVDAMRIDAAQTLLALQMPSLVLFGRPTSPRLKLYAESEAGDILLWQSMLAGVQDGVTLPALPLIEEWAPALQQLKKLAAAASAPDATPAITPLRLRLDVQSDAPCRVTLATPALVLETETELLEAPLKLAFRGDRAQSQTLPVVLPTGFGSLRLAGRVAADSAGDAAGLAPPADGRRGALLGEGTVVLQAMDFSAPVSLAGVALHWQALSDQLALRLRLLADSQGQPGERLLAQAQATIDTAGAAALVFRWPALDLQAQRAWIEVTVSAGAGLWLFAASGGPGSIESRSGAGARQPLPAPLAMAPIPAVTEGSAARAIGVALGGRTVAATLPQGPFEITVAAGLESAPVVADIVITGAVRGSVTLESVRWVGRCDG